MTSPRGAKKRINIGPNVIVTAADATVTSSAAVVLADRPDRDAAIVQNQSDTVTIRLGDSAITASRGIRLGPGETATLYTTAAVYGISEGANVTVARAETRFTA